jgi:hypothetical protein
LDRVGLVVLAAGMLAAGCTRTAPTFSRALAADVPDASNLPIAALGLGPLHARSVGIGPGSSLSTVRRSPDFNSRPGLQGQRSAELTDPASHKLVMDVETLLYQSDTTSKARAFWDAFPPEDIDGGQNLREYPPASYPSLVRRSSFVVASGGASSKWKAMCLVGGDYFGTPCSAFVGWVRFCRWNMEINLSTGPIPWSQKDPRVPKFMAAVADQTSLNVGCAS